MTGRPASCTAEGQAKAIRTVFDAIHAANPDPKVLAYQYLQALPQIAAGPANKVWIVPTELTKALGALGQTLPNLVKQAEAVVPETSVDLPKPAEPVLDLRDGASGTSRA